MTTNAKATALGTPILTPVLIPVLHCATPHCINESFMVEGRSHKITCLSFGTPHGIEFVQDLQAVDIQTLGPLLSTHRLFPKGASIIFAQITGKDSLKMHLWQQYMGKTDFTTEAVGVAATAAILLGMLQTPTVTVYTDSHEFTVHWDRSINNVFVSQL